MKRLLIIILVFFCFNIQAFASGSNNPNQALEYINDYRSQLNIPILKENKNLNKAATNHSNYLATYDTISNQEDNSKLLFTGVYPWDRSAYFQYLNPLLVEFNDQNNTYKSALIDLFNNPYNRIDWLNPNFIDIGMGNTKDKYTFMLGGDITDTEVKIKYPMPNQKNIPISYRNKVGINPYRKSYDRDLFYSIPISYSYFTPKEIKEIVVHNNRTKLVNKNNNENIPIVISTPSNDEYLYNSILILPLRQMDFGIEYEVTVNMTINFNDGTKKEINDDKWVFTTATMPNYLKQIESVETETNITRQKFAELIVNKLNLPTNYKKNNIFSDVSDRSYYSKYIYCLKDLGIIGGYPDNTFKPTNYVKREEAIMFIMQAYNYKLNRNYMYEPTFLYETFDDIKSCSNWARKAIETAYYKRIISGRPNNKFEPKSYITIDEAEILVDNLSKYLMLRGR